MQPQNDKKTALVTGGARRIGAAICRRLHQEGYRVIIHHHQSVTEARDLAQELNHQRSGSASTISLSLASEADYDAFIQEVQTISETTTLLVNNASTFFPTPVGSVSQKELNAMLATNVVAPVMLTQSFTRHCPAECIINITDIHAVTPLADYSIYSMTKAALSLYTRAMALELAPTCRVNAVAPGAILWPEKSATLNADEKQKLIEDIPMQRLGNVEAIAEAVSYLANAEHVTGQTLTVDGGQSI